MRHQLLVVAADHHQHMSGKQMELPSSGGGALPSGYDNNAMERQQESFGSSSSGSSAGVKARQDEEGGEGSSMAQHSTTLAPPQPPPIPLPPMLDTICGRDQELAQLIDLFRESSNGSSRVVLISGPSGMGKSALARCLERHVLAPHHNHSSMFVWGKCGDPHQHTNHNHNNNSTIPYRPFLQAMQRWMDELIMWTPPTPCTTATTTTTTKEHYNTTSSRAHRQLARIQRALHQTTASSPEHARILADMIPSLAQMMTTTTGTSSTYSASGSSTSPSIVTRPNHRRPSASSILLEKTSSVYLAGDMSCTTSREQHGITTGDMMEPLAKHPTKADAPSVVLFTKFIQAYCKDPAFSLVFFLDDLQWLDAGSLALFQALCVARIDGLLILGTCRGNEIQYDHQLAQCLRCIEDQHHIAIQEVALPPLTLPAVDALVQQVVPTLDVTTRQNQVSPLVMQHTHGNPFFVQQFLWHLQEQHVLLQRQDQQEWIWDPVRLELLLASRNAASRDALDRNQDNRSFHSAWSEECIELVQSRMHNLGQTSPVVAHVLQVASCLGSEFSESHILAATPMWAPSVVLDALAVLEQEELILRQQAHVQLSMVATYRWAHDRFQQVAYDMVEQQAKLHLTIGRNLLQGLPVVELQRKEQSLFFVVNQFCRGNTVHAWKTYPGDRAQVAALCLAAGEAASLSSDFRSAAKYLNLGIDLLGTPKEAFARHYLLAFGLYNGAAEMECCLGNYTAVDRFVDAILEHALTLEDKMRAYEAHIYSLGSRQDLDGAIRFGCKILRQLGCKVPRRRKVGPVTLVSQVLATKWKISRISAEDILSLDPMQDSKALACMRILYHVYPHALRVNPELGVLMALRALDLTLRYGQSPLASFGFSTFSMLLCNPLGCFKEGSRVADISQRIFEKYNCHSAECRVQVAYWGFTRMCVAPIKEAIEPLKTAVETGLLTGDIEMACLGNFLYSCAAVFTGSPLAAMEKELIQFRAQCTSLRQETILFYIQTLGQLVENFLGKSSDPLFLTGGFFVEYDGLDLAEQLGEKGGVMLVLLFKAILAVYFNKFETAFALAKKLRKYRLDPLTTSLLYQVYFVDGLAEVVAANLQGKSGRGAGNRGLQQLRKYAKHTPENALNKIFLIEAERYLLRGRFDKAIGKFEQSIEHAAKQGFLNEEALACERLGLAYADRRDNNRAAVHLGRAKQLYTNWGSPQKVTEISKALLKLKILK